MKRFRIQNEQDTGRVAEVLCACLKGGVSVGLRGDLGAGKTTLVRYLVSAFHGDTRAVASPTYTLQHEYRLPNGMVLEHWDLYRLTSLPLELEERVGSNVIRLIEWPEKCPEIQSELSFSLSLSITDTYGGVDRILSLEGINDEKLEKALRAVVSEV